MLSLASTQTHMCLSDLGHVIQLIHLWTDQRLFLYVGPLRMSALLCNVTPPPPPTHPPKPDTHINAAHVVATPKFFT